MKSVKDMCELTGLTKQCIRYRMAELGITPCVKRKWGRNGEPAYYTDEALAQVLLGLNIEYRSDLKKNIHKSLQPMYGAMKKKLRLFHDGAYDNLTVRELRERLYKEVLTYAILPS